MAIKSVSGEKVKSKTLTLGDAKPPYLGVYVFEIKYTLKNMNKEYLWHFEVPSHLGKFSPNLILLAEALDTYQEKGLGVASQLDEIYWQEVDSLSEENEEKENELTAFTTVGTIPVKPLMELRELFINSIPVDRGYNKVEIIAWNLYYWTRKGVRVEAFIH